VEGGGERRGRGEEEVGGGGEYGSARNAGRLWLGF